jgi:2-oxoisovalerate dehydrogenase E1 component
LAAEHGLQARVLDLRWLAPLALDEILAAIASCDRVLIVDECRGTGSQSEAIATLIRERTDRSDKIGRVVADDSFIPLGRASTLTLPSRDSIVDAALKLVAD